jgi:dUTP pyrophosphatase
MIIKVINQSKHPLPEYQTPLSAGLDLRANINEPVVLKPLERKLIGTGLYIELAAGFEAQVRPRSGMAYKHGLSVLNTPGTIDADYRGEVKVLLVNLSNESFTVEDGERIAQMVVTKHERITWQPVQKLSDTERGAGGYGSTGKS